MPGCAHSPPHTAVVTKCDHYGRLRLERTDAMLLTEEIFLKGFYQRQFTITTIYRLKISHIGHVVFYWLQEFKNNGTEVASIYIKIRELVQKLKMWNVKTNPNTRVREGERKSEIITSSFLGKKGRWREEGCIYKIWLWRRVAVRQLIFRKILPPASSGVIGFFLYTDYPWTRKQGEFLQDRRPFSQGTVALSWRLESSEARVEKLTVGTCIIWNASMKTAQPIYRRVGGLRVISIVDRRKGFLLFGGEGVINDTWVNNVLRWWHRYLKVLHCVKAGRWQRPGCLGHVKNSLHVW